MIKLFTRMAVVVLVILVAGISSMGVQSELYPVDGSKLIEVCADGIVFVPPGTKLVRCNGKIRKVLYFEEGVSKDNCKCPHCCEGVCYVVVICEPLPQERLDGITRDCATGELHFENPDDQVLLCSLWLGC